MEWEEPGYTGGGFPRVVYLRYHGYSKFFPLWALARYRNVMRANEQRVARGLAVDLAPVRVNVVVPDWSSLRPCWA